MITELEPHRIHTRIDCKWTEVRSSSFPPDLDPYGEIPPEVEEITEDIKSYVGFFKRMLVAGVNEKTPEANVMVDLSSKDDSGRDLAVRIHIDFIGSRMANGSDATRVETNRLFLYENGVAVKKVEDWLITEDKWEETILSQDFVTERNLHLLEFARNTIYASPAYPKP